MDKLGLGSIDGLLSAGRVLAVPRWGGVAAMAQLGDMAAWSHPLEDLLPEPALAAPALLGQKEGEYADAAEAYAVNAALTPVSYTHLDTGYLPPGRGAAGTGGQSAG